MVSADMNLVQRKCTILVHLVSAVKYFRGNNSFHTSVLTEVFSRYHAQPVYVKNIAPLNIF